VQGGNNWQPHNKKPSAEGFLLWGCQLRQLLDIIIVVNIVIFYRIILHNAAFAYLICAFYIHIDLIGFSAYWAWAH
jgi:hypothetical protein